MTILDDAIEAIWKTAEDEKINLDKIKYTGHTRNGTEYNVRCSADTDNFTFIKQIFHEHDIETRNAHINEDNEFEIIIDPDTATSE